MKCLSPRRITKNLDLNKFPQGLQVPCGQCMNCRIIKRDEWVLRLMHESKGWESCIFFTLTYSDDHLPENESLVKSDLQKFFKRLRKVIGNRKIKYFACGEYGDEKARPHYHVILFGMDYFDSNDKEIIKRCWGLCDWSMLGKKPFGDVTPASIRYVVGYIEKKILGKWEEFAYEDIEKPFHLVSKGIGRDVAMASSKEIEQGYFEMSGRKKSVPRYYRKVTGFEGDNFKLYGEEREKEMVSKLIGVFATRDEIYLSEDPKNVIYVEEEISRSNRQHDKNIRSRVKLNSRLKKIKDI